MEIWKDVVDFEGLYQVSNMGNVRSLNYRNTGKEGVLKPQKHNRGYLCINLSKEGKCKTFTIHRLVAEAFIPNIDNKPDIDHINTIRDDNRVENLRWVTKKENNNNELSRKHNSEARKGKHHTEESKKKMSESRKGKDNHRKGKHHSEETKTKMSESRKKKVYCVETNKTYPSVKQCARELRLNKSSISNVCNGKQKQTKGYHFYYVENILYMN